MSNQRAKKILRPQLCKRPWLCTAKHWMLAHLVLDTTVQTAKKCHNSSGCFLRRTGLPTRKLTKTTPFQDDRKRNHQGINLIPMNSWLNQEKGQLLHQKCLIWMCAFNFFSVILCFVKCLRKSYENGLAKNECFKLWPGSGFGISTEILSPGKTNK